MVNRTLVTWDVNGNPIVSTAPVIAKGQIEELALAALSLPYEDPLGLEPEFAGMTNVEVMMVKMARKAASGDMDVTEKLLDRVLGKPKQSSEVKSVKLTYEDALKEMARLAGSIPAGGPDIPAPVGEGHKPYEEDPPPPVDIIAVNDEPGKRRG